ncbi:unnamed protein product, partial [Didymodactylos carnosus]
ETYFSILEVDDVMEVENQTHSSYNYMDSVNDDLLLNSRVIESLWLQYTFVFLSTIEIFFGLIGNGLVIYIFLTRSTIKTSHNYFIANLALSDFILCLITIPLNIYRNLNIYMTFPPVFCHLAEAFPAVNVYVSSLTITAIAIDRYLAVKYPHIRLIGPIVATIILLCIWIISITASSPLFIYSTSSKVYDDSLINVMIIMNCDSTNNTNTSSNECQKYHLSKYQKMHVCLEEWPSGRWRLIERVVTLIFQCIVPILIISVTYYQILCKLKERFRYRFLIKKHNIPSLRQEIRRQRRINILLFSIMFIFAISWLPFNIYHIVFINKIDNSKSSSIYDTNLEYHKKTPTNSSTYVPLILLICMISAVTNPFLYGYFNENFEIEFRQLFSFLTCCAMAEKEQQLFSKRQSTTKHQKTKHQKMLQINEISKIYSSQIRDREQTLTSFV